MLDALIDNLFVQFGGLVFQEIIGISMEADCSPLLPDLLLHTNETDFIQELIKNKD